MFGPRAAFQGQQGPGRVAGGWLFLLHNARCWQRVVGEALALTGVTEEKAGAARERPLFLAARCLGLAVLPTAWVSGQVRPDEVSGGTEENCVRQSLSAACQAVITEPRATQRGRAIFLSPFLWKGKWRPREVRQLVSQRLNLGLRGG